MQQEFSCAYRPQDNGVCEQMHRTIKTSVVRTSRTVDEAVFWHNVTSVGDHASSFEMVFGMRPKLPGVRKQREGVDQKMEIWSDDDHVKNSVDELSTYVVGDKVFLKDSGRCTDAWSGPHRVTTLWSPVAVELVTTRHVGAHVKNRWRFGTRFGWRWWNVTENGEPPEC